MNDGHYLNVMVVSLKEVLELKPGTLIRGLKINFSGSMNFSLDGWHFDQRKLVKSLLSYSDRDRFCYTYYKNSKVQEHINNNSIHINDGTNLTFGVFRANGEAFFKDMQTWFIQDIIDDGECLGMSLGENFIALQPSHHDMYRADYYQVYVFHKVLHGQAIKWIALHSKQVSKQLILCNNPSLMDIVLELI